ncbi:hypothetical protein RhiirC2_857166 [Rhizophagus irregularis]|uniref:Uncharacterized protein n=1 Tax=Rhizophagus irregularis TaxID=588596 RepID=A0A2N1MDV3_9GLOM|nr:hypothetical protein RhiirC2_857166 [Rhizophagus irregularis]
MHRRFDFCSRIIRILGISFDESTRDYLFVKQYADEVFFHISQTSCRNSSCGLLVPPKVVFAGFLGFSEQFLWTSWTTSWLSGEDFS